MEQLINRDLPAMAATFPGGFSFGLAKGRGRYFCPSKADVALGDGLQSGLDLDENTPDAPALPQAQAITVIRSLGESFDSGTWSGDRDSLADTVGPQDWSAVAADRASCTGRHCPHFKTCPSYSN